MSSTTDYGLLGLISGSRIAVPLLGVLVEAEVHDFLCEVTVHQTYRNAHATDIEAVYHFPVDEAAAVCGFRAEYEDGVVVDAVVKEKSEARKEYTNAVRSGKQAQLLESVRPDIFTMSIGRMPSDALITIKITYIALLKADGSAARFLLPTHFAQRYSPANNFAPPVPMVASSFKPLIGLDVAVKFNTQSNIKALRSTSHAREIQTHVNGKHGEARLQNIAMNSDLVILCEEERPHQPRACVEIALDGTMAGLVTLFPEIEFRDEPREIIFIIDRSGSMGFGRDRDRDGKTQMESAREALMLFLRALPASCTFNVIGFGNKFSSLFPTPQPYTDATLEQATRYAATMEANMGGTEILKPLEHALRGKSSGRKRQVFVLTDGQVSNETQVFDLVRGACAGGVSRTFCLGLGAGVSHLLVEGIARAGRGTASFVVGGDAEALHVQVLSQLKNALQPSLDNVTVTWNCPAPAPPPVPAPSAPVKTLLGYRSPDIDAPPPPSPAIPKAFPSVAPPVFNRERFVSFALFPTGHTQVPTSVTVTASTPDGPLEVELPITEDEILSGDIAHRLAARTAIREFEESGSARGLPGPRVSKSEALALALNSRLASSQTSFVAVRSDSAGAHNLSPQDLDESADMAALRAEEALLFRHLQTQSAACARSVQPLMTRCGPLDLTDDCQVSWRACTPEPSLLSRLGGFSLQSLAGSMGGSMLNSAKSARGSSLRTSATRECAAPAVRGGGSGGWGSGGGILSSLFGGSAAPASEKRCESATKAANEEEEDALDTCLSALQDEEEAQPPPPALSAPRKKKSAASARSAQAAPPVVPSGPPAGGVFGLCMLQRADGSFALDAKLAAALGVSLAALQQAARAALQHCAPEIAESEGLVGTLVAVAGMRVVYRGRKSTYELQERKAVAFLCAASALTPETVDKCVQHMATALAAGTRTSQGA